MPAYKDKVKKAIPERLKTQDYRTLLVYMNRNKITSTAKLKTFLNVREGELQNFIKTKKGSVSASTMRTKASQLDWVKRVRKSFLKYLP